MHETPAIGRFSQGCDEHEALARPEAWHASCTLGGSLSDCGSEKSGSASFRLKVRLMGSALRIALDLESP
jgi:hypothetical protein